MKFESEFKLLTTANESWNTWMTSQLTWGASHFLKQMAALIYQLHLRKIKMFILSFWYFVIVIWSFLLWNVKIWHTWSCFTPLRPALPYFFMEFNSLFFWLHTCVHVRITIFFAISCFPQHRRRKWIYFHGVLTEIATIIFNVITASL